MADANDWVLYRYIDANGVEAFAYARRSQAPALLLNIKQAGGTDTRHQATFDSDAGDVHIQNSQKYGGAKSFDEVREVGEAADTGDFEKFFADFAGGGATLRNFIASRGIDPQGGMSNTIQNLLLAPAEASLGFGQGLNPAVAGENFTLSNLLNAGGLRGLATNARMVFNDLANSGMGVAGEDSLQNPASEGSNLASQTRNLALGALMQRSPYFAAMFGNNAINNASQQYFEQQRAGQAGGGGPLGSGPRNLSDSIRDTLGRNLFSGV
jgi:hypothetical protein